MDKKGDRMNIKLLGKNIIIEPLEEETKDLEKSAGGIFMPSTAREAKPNNLKKAKVINVGVKCEHINVNDIVYYNKRSITTMTFDNADYSAIQEDSIIGFVSKE